MKKRLLLLLFLLFLTGAGCSRKTNQIVQNKASVPDTSTSTLSLTTSSTSNFIPSSINLNNFATWPRFAFKELGFSIQLPIEENSLYSRLGVCKNKELTQFANNKQSVIVNKICNSSTYNYQRFSAVVSSTKKLGNLYSFVEANSEFNFLPYGIEGPFLPSFPYDFYKKSDKYYFMAVPNIIIFDSYGVDNHYVFTPITNHGKNPEFEIHPLSIILYQGHEIIIYDMYCDYYNGMFDEKTACTTANAEYQVLIKLNNNKYFKVASLGFDLNSLQPTLDKVKEIVNSIKFISP